MTVSARREVVRFAKSRGHSERRACALVGLRRSTCRYTHRRRDPADLVERLRARVGAASLRLSSPARLASTRGAEGQPQARVPDLPSCGLRGEAPHATQTAGIAPAADHRARAPQLALVDGLLARPHRWPAAVHAQHRRRVHARVPGDRARHFAARRPSRARARHGSCGSTACPSRCASTAGPEFISTALDRWASAHGVALHFIQPGKPTQNAHVESFNSRCRDEGLSQAHWPTLARARVEAELWRVDYNCVRPQSSRAYETPAFPRPRAPQAAAFGGGCRRLARREHGGASSPTRLPVSRTTE